MDTAMLKKKKFTLKQIVAAIGTGLAAGFAGSVALHRYNAYTHQQVYGTLQEPSFQVCQAIDEGKQSEHLGKLDHPVHTYSSTSARKHNLENAALEEVIQRMEGHASHIKQVRALPAKVQNYLQGISGKEELTFDEQRQLMSASMELQKLELELDTMVADYARMSIGQIAFSLDNTHEKLNSLIISAASAMPTVHTEEKEYGSAVEHAKELFRKMTGKSFPPDIHFDIEEITQKEIAGNANFISKEVQARPKTYASTICTLIHEIGHLATQHDETEYYNLASKWSVLIQNPDTRVMLLEEASAYALEFTAAHYESDQQLRKEMLVTTIVYAQHMIEDLYNGNTEYHRAAVAIADAAITVFGSPKNAYNYLATLQHDQVIDARITKVIEDNRTSYHANTRLKEQMKELIGKNQQEIDLARSEITPLVEKLQKAEEKYLPRIDWGELEVGDVPTSKPKD